MNTYARQIQSQAPYAASLSVLIWIIVIIIIIVQIVKRLNKKSTFQQPQKNIQKPKNQLKTTTIREPKYTLQVYNQEFITQESNPTKYQYILRRHIMTAYEERFFLILCEIFNDRCYVIPQVYLSKLLDHKVKQQNWQGALSHINRKSVDFVLLRKSDLTALCAIELDDWSHHLDKRKERDLEVERIFNNVHLPLVRFDF